MRDLTLNEIEFVSAGDLSCPQPPPESYVVPVKTSDKQQKALLDVVKA